MDMREVCARMDPGFQSSGTGNNAKHITHMHARK